MNLLFKKETNINWKKFLIKEIIIIFLLVLIPILFIIDWNFYKWGVNNEKKIYIFSLYWTTWTISYSTVMAIILLSFKLVLFKRCAIIKNNGINEIAKINNYFYDFAKISAGVYNFFIFVVYNFLLLFYNKLITNDSKTIVSIIEHQIVPSIFLIFLILDIFELKKYNFLQLSNFLVKTSIFPIAYSFYILVIGINSDSYPYFFFNIKNIGVKGFFAYFFLTLSVILLINIIFLTPSYIDYFLKNKKKYKQ